MVKALADRKGERSEQAPPEYFLPQVTRDALESRWKKTIIADQLSDVTYPLRRSDRFHFALASQLSARDLVQSLNGLFSEFDRLALSFGVEKMGKTVGDACMLAGGVPEPRADNAHAVADTALAMLEAVKRTNYELPVPLQMRIGNAFGRCGGWDHWDSQICLRRLGRCREPRQSHGVPWHAKPYPDLGCHPSAHSRALSARATRLRRYQGKRPDGNIHPPWQALKLEMWEG